MSRKLSRPERSGRLTLAHRLPDPGPSPGAQEWMVLGRIAEG